MVDFSKHIKRKPRIDLNPSSADRWTTCTASPQYILANWERLPAEDRKFSDPGNTAHEVAAALLQNRPIDLTACPVPPTAEMHGHAFYYADFVESLRKPGSKLFVEQMLPLFYAESRNAIVDAAVINPDCLHIVDLKYGEGIIVSSENNLQATIYAKSVEWNWHKWGFPMTGVGSFACHHPDDFPVYISIYQPRTRDAAAPFHTWETTLGEIRERAKHIFRIATLIMRHAVDPLHPDNYAEKLEFAPSEKACQWCPAKGFCEARQLHLTKDLPQLAVIDGSAKPVANVLTDTQLAAIVEHGPQIKKWIDDASKYALSRLLSGGKIPGFKVVTSNGGHRKWTDEERAGKLLLAQTILRTDEIFTKSLNSPAQIEKLIGKGKIPLQVFNLISKPPGWPTIAPENDPRPSCNIDAASEFENLDAPQFDLDQF